MDFLCSDKGEIIGEGGSKKKFGTNIQKGMNSPQNLTLRTGISASGIWERKRWVKVSQKLNQ